jgi:hypothetical protein
MGQWQNGKVFTSGGMVARSFAPIHPPREPLRHNHHALRMRLLPFASSLPATSTLLPPASSLPPAPLCTMATVFKENQVASNVASTRVLGAAKPLQAALPSRYLSRLLLLL